MVEILGLIDDYKFNHVYTAAWKKVEIYEG